MHLLWELKCSLFKLQSSFFFFFPSLKCEWFPSDPSSWWTCWAAGSVEVLALQFCPPPALRCFCCPWSPGKVSLDHHIPRTADCTGESDYFPYHSVVVQARFIQDFIPFFGRGKKWRLFLILWMCMGIAGHHAAPGDGTSRSWGLYSGATPAAAPAPHLNSHLCLRVELLGSPASASVTCSRNLLFIKFLPSFFVFILSFPSLLLPLLFFLQCPGVV